MPSPLELLLDPVSLTVLALYAALIAWEAIAPARPLPVVRGWKFWALRPFSPTSSCRRICRCCGASSWRASSSSTLPASASGARSSVVLLVEFGIYVWHRTMHSSDRLWRMFHQMHHSAERVDTYGAFWFSPADMVGWTVLGSLALTLVGLSRRSDHAVLLVTTLLAVFQHTNVRTPQWLGYLVQRPEIALLSP